MFRTLLAGVAAITMVTGYAWAETPPAPDTAKDQSMDASLNCPMSVTGAKVSTAPTPTGVTLTFSTTSPEKVADLRRRVHDAAEMHNKNHGSGGMREDMMGDGMMGGMTGGGHMMGSGNTAGHMTGGHMMASGNAAGHMTGGQMMPQSRAAMTEVEHGARLTLTPSDPADLQKLQSAIATRAERMQQHGCGPVATR
jgi:hypothetical protein